MVVETQELAKWMNRWTHDGHIDGYRWVCGWMDGRMAKGRQGGERVDRAWMDGWIGRRIEWVEMRRIG